MLNLIDHLPRDCYYTQAVSEDEEHAAMLLAARKDGRADHAPPMSSWSAEVGVLADLVDAVNSLRQTFIAANSKPGSNNAKFTPYPRPRTAVEKVRRAQRQAKHEALVARVKRRGTV